MKKILIFTFLGIFSVSSLLVALYMTRVNTTGSARPKKSLALETDRQVDVNLYPQALAGRTGEAIIIKPILFPSSQKTVGFIQLAITYNPNLLSFLGSDEQNLDPGFVYFRSAENSSSEAGKLLLTYGAINNEERRVNKIELSDLQFRVLNDQAQSDAILVDIGKSQIVFNDQSLAEIKSESPVSLNLSPIQDSLTPTATSIPTETPTPPPSLSPKSVTPELTQFPTASPTGTK